MGRFGGARLVVRLEADFLAGPGCAPYRRRIERMAEGRRDVAVSRPSVADASTRRFAGWPGLGEDRFLPSLLRHADLVVNTASTTSVQAGIFDTPVVSLDFHHGTEARGLYDSYEAHAFRQSHYEQLVVRAGGADLAGSYGELLSKMTRALSRPGLGREGRRRMVEGVCDFLGRGARERMVQEILKLCPRPVKTAGSGGPRR